MSARSDLALPTLAVREAMDFIGLEEEGDNRGPAVEWFQKLAKVGPGAPWCAAFVNACAEIAAAKKNMTSPLEAVPLEAYVQSYVDYGRHRGWHIQPEATPLVGLGDLFCLWYGYLNDGEGRYGHIGFVSRPPRGENATFETVEGNSNLHGGREGIEVVTKTRPVTSGTLFLKWSQDDE